MKRMVALLMMLTTAVFCCRADLRYWTGAAGDSYWNNAANWNGGALPSYGDTVIFTNDTPISVNINAYGGVNTWPNHRVYQFDGKDVTIFSTETRYVKLHGGSGTDPRIYVTAGTTVTISNSVNSYNENGQIAKWGAGTLRQISVNANSCYAGDYSAKLRIAEGRWEMRIGTSHSYHAYPGFSGIIYPES